MFDSGPLESMVGRLGQWQEGRKDFKTLGPLFMDVHDALWSLPHWMTRARPKRAPFSRRHFPVCIAFDRSDPAGVSSQRSHVLRPSAGRVDAPLAVHSRARGIAMSLETDVLIIGCGIAGAAAALRLSKDPNRRVLVITRESDPHESATLYAQGGIVSRGEKDTTQLLSDDICRAGAGLSHPQAVCPACRAGPQRVHELLIETPQESHSRGSNRARRSGFWKALIPFPAFFTSSDATRPGHRGADDRRRSRSVRTSNGGSAGPRST